MKKVVEVNLQLDEKKVIGKTKEEINNFLQTTVLPTLLDGLTERSRGGEAGCSVSDHGWECHAGIRW
ncbi:MAG: hypothetical protein JST26_19835 [Bacteroidetes bacterium]|nr:hypothetical protein [Bacteroidota bacterium]